MTEIIVLRLVHIVGGIFWVGSGLFTALFMFPALTAAGPAAAQVVAALQQRRLFTVLPVVAVLTILSGLRLMWIMSGGFDGAYFASARGGTYSAAAVAGILAFLLALFIARPAGIRLGALSGALANAPDDAARALIMQQLTAVRRRSAAVGRVITVLLILSAAGMAVARYLGMT